MKYAFKKVRKITIKDPATKENKAVIDEIKSAQITGNADVVYADGADGAHLVGFDVSKVAGVTFVNGAIDEGYLELQTGGAMETVTNGTDVLYTEILTISTADTLVTTYKATGTVGNEIAFLYPIDETGSPDRAHKLTQAATVAAGKFAYAPATKTISFNTGEGTVGTQYYVEYFPKFTTYEEMSNDSDKFSMTGEVYLDCWFTRICDKKDVPLQLYLPSGKISGEINLGIGDAAAELSGSIEAMKSCGDTSLWKLRKYDLTDVSAE
jgi:hypothetical protein